MIRPVSLDVSDFEECFEEHQWWHYQIMADNSKKHAHQREQEESKNASFSTMTGTPKREESRGPVVEDFTNPMLVPCDEILRKYIPAAVSIQLHLPLQ